MPVSKSTPEAEGVNSKKQHRCLGQAAPHKPDSHRAACFTVPQTLESEVSNFAKPLPATFKIR